MQISSTQQGTLAMSGTQAKMFRRARKQGDLVLGENRKSLKTTTELAQMLQQIAEKDTEAVILAIFLCPKVK